jgi:hypothetical protein
LGEGEEILVPFSHREKDKMAEILVPLSLWERG